MLGYNVRITNTVACSIASIWYSMTCTESLCAQKRQTAFHLNFKDGLCCYEFKMQYRVRESGPNDRAAACENFHFIVLGSFLKLHLSFYETS